MYESPCYYTNLRRAAQWTTEYYDRMLAPSGL